MTNIFKDKESFERFKESVYQSQSPEALTQRTSVGTTYWWIFGVTKKGRTIFWGPYYSVQEADRDLTNLDDGELFEFDTTDITRATRELKSELMKRGIDPDEAMKRVGHKREGS